MGKFDHLKASVESKSYKEIAEWRPPTWIGKTPAPVLKLIRLTETNERFARASLNPRIKQPRQRANGRIKASDLKVQRERRLILAIIGGVVGWENVFEPTKNVAADIEPYKSMPFPAIGEEQNDAGVQEVRELLAVLGQEAELDFFAFCVNQDNWLADGDAEDEEEDEDRDSPVVPFTRPSPST
jgi:hypothetical protein